LTVKLVAKDGTFTATGVIYKATVNKTWVLTAAHNLHVYRGNDYRKTHGELKAKFKSDIQVLTYEGMKTDDPPKYDISAVLLADEHTAYGYDGCALRIDGLPLATLAREKYLALGHYDFTGIADAKFNIHDDVAAFVGEANGLAQWALFQVGYGKFKKW